MQITSVSKNSTANVSSWLKVKILSLAFTFCALHMWVCIDGFYMYVCMAKQSSENWWRGIKWERACKTLPRTKKHWRLLILLKLEELINSGQWELLNLYKATRTHRLHPHQITQTTLQKVVTTVCQKYMCHIYTSEITTETEGISEHHPEATGSSTLWY